MIVDKDRVVLFHYRLTSVDGDFSESSDPASPVAALVGHGNVLAALEEAMMGKSTGDQFEVTLEPGDAYGERVAGAVQRVPIKHLMTRKGIKPGMAVKVNTADGPRDATIIKVGKFNVDLDTNHPLAGKQLHFHIAIEQVREAEPEEVSHGHAHGSGGHHH